MKFRLVSLLWAFALLASAMATFGALGILSWLIIILFWTCIKTGQKANSLGYIIAIVTVVLIVVMLLHSVQSAREVARRAQCMNNMKWLSLSLLNYESTNGQLPAASQSDPNSEHPHSWRVWVLPFLESSNIYSKYRMDQPWHSAANTKLINNAWPMYPCTCPAHSHTEPNTHYFAVVGEQTMWPPGRGRKISEVVDGTSNTIMLIESQHKAVPWAKPEDLSFEKAVELLTDPPTSSDFGHLVDEGFFHKPSSGINVAFADASVRFLPLPISKENAIAILTADGGEAIDFDDVQQLTSPELDFGRIYALCLFVLLSLAPVAKLKEKKNTSEENEA